MRRYPPIAQLTVASLALIVIGGAAALTLNRTRGRHTVSSPAAVRCG